MDSTWVPKFGYPLTLLCERCTTERREAFDRATGVRITKPHYKYPRGYKYAKHETPTRDDFRVLLVSVRMREARQRRENGETK